MCSSWISQLLPVEQVTDELPSAALAEREGAALAGAGSRTASPARMALLAEKRERGDLTACTP
jgi:hypothetical protein